MLVDISKIEILDVKPGDLVVFKLNEPTTKKVMVEVIEAVADKLREWYPGCHVLVTTEGIEIKVIRGLAP